VRRRRRVGRREGGREGWKVQAEDGCGVLEVVGGAEGGREEGREVE